NKRNENFNEQHQQINRNRQSILHCGLNRCTTCNFILHFSSTKYDILKTIPYIRSTITSLLHSLELFVKKRSPLLSGNGFFCILAPMKNTYSYSFCFWFEIFRKA